MPKHTPGPWQICSSDDGRPYIRAGESGPIVAKAYRATVGHGPLPGTANARLIAAAPELLAALEQLVRMDLGLDCCDTDEQARRWAVGRAAVAKAKGDAK